MASGKAARRFVYAGVTRLAGGGATQASADTLGGVFRLEIGGDGWQHLVAGLPEPTHVYCVTVSPLDPDTIYIGTNDGPYVSRNRAESWRRTDFSARNVPVWSITCQPGTPRRMLAGTAPTGIWLSDDAGESWRPARKSHIEDRLPMGSFVNRVMRIAVDHLHPDLVYSALEVNGVMLSSDGGESWRDGNADLLRLSGEPGLGSAILTQSKSEGMLDVHALATSPAAPRTVFLACRMGLFASKDAGESWRDLEVGRFSKLTYGRDIRLSPHDPNVLYACLSVASNGDTGTVCRSADLGRTWQRIDHGVQGLSTMMAVALHPQDPGVIFGAARHGQVFGTLDDGRSWNDYRLPAGCKGVYALACG